jgi:hypothetical protein
MRNHSISKVGRPVEEKPEDPGKEGNLKKLKKITH